MAIANVLNGCCVSRFVTLSKSDNNLRDLLQTGVFAQSVNVHWVVVDPKVHDKVLEAFLETEIEHQKLGDGKFFFTGSGNQFRNALDMERLRPIIEWEKKEGRKRGELRKGDIVDVSGYLGASYEGRVREVLRNGNFIFEVAKVPRGSSYPVGRVFDNYGTGWPKENFTIILPTVDNDR
jgi:hypothetical protein